MFTINEIVLQYVIIYYNNYIATNKLFYMHILKRHQNNIENALVKFH